MPRILPPLALLALTACQIPPVEPMSARFDGESLVLTFSDGRVCDLAVPAAPPWEFGPTAGCPPLTAVRAEPAPGPNAPDVLIQFNAERPLQGEGLPVVVWVWVDAGPYRFSR